MPKADPHRSCLGCREVRPKTDLLRFVMDPDGVICPDIAGKLPGRGAYTCFNKNCLAQAIRRRQFSRAFRTELKAPSEEELTALVAMLLKKRMSSLLALANKAGNAVSGSEKVMESLKKGDVAVLVLAADISSESRAKFLAVAEKNGVGVFTFSDKDQLGSLLGKEIRSAVAIRKGPFSAALQSDFSRYWNFFEGGAK